MARAQYRSEMVVIHEILAITADGGRMGANVSNISLKANLSHYAAIEKCDRLLEAGLMEQHVTKGSRVFCMTSKGLMFFRELDRFQNIVSSLNLRC